VARPHFRRLVQLGGAWMRSANVSYTPPRLAKIYNFPTGMTGTGQTIGIIELGGGYVNTDLNDYFKGLALASAPAVSVVSVNGARNSPTGQPDGPDGEVMLDIEVAGSIAPDCNIVIYFAPNTDRGFLSAVHAAVYDDVNKPSVISISWGGPEGTWTKQSLQAFNQAFKAAGALGVTVCIAAGDGGSEDGVNDGRVHADFPASSPYVIACGGTRLLVSNDTVASETVWNDGARGGGTGGGVSDFFPLPSWQTTAKVPLSGNPAHHKGRGLPDVAANADPVTGYDVLVDGQDVVVGGTSAVAPMWAGLIALANQSLGKSIGYVNPILYEQFARRPTLFRDIVSGSNDIDRLGLGYAAKTGWDPCSGWGSVDGLSFVAALKGEAPKEEEMPEAQQQPRTGRSRGRAS
jgi:kumamolisin